MGEAAAVQGHFALHTLRDIEAFYDSIQIPVVIENAMGLGFPADMLAIACQVHLPPRILRVARSCSEPLFVISRSIFAGCTL